MKKLTTLTRLAIIGLALGSLLIFYAYVYADWSERTGRTIGASIGAGILGIFGIQIAIVSALTLVIALILSYQKKH